MDILPSRKLSICFKVSTRQTIADEIPMMFMSFGLTSPETRYHTSEREMLAVLKCLEEVRWLVKGSQCPVMLYTDHIALKGILGENPDLTGRMARWQYRLQPWKSTN
ncbi:hypothetical protein N7493_008260 [Penicillium malachiteum]|uniref:Reverse transcriptase RNase H-like domain-containing protein n=1 Tax=Penicillium malachiteum TaxID=1324776 RepID=A0AAD6MTJ6_9EURO|nr:hypothetical protein N7493_008260 [Penicillium malachiteum]